MGNRKRKKGRKRRASPKKKPQGGAFFFKDPFSQIPRERLMPALVEHAKASKQKFQETLDSICTVLRSNEPLQVITTLAVFGLSTGMADDGKLTSLSKNNRISQAHVELVQALSLTIPATEIQNSPPNGHAIQQLFDLLPKLGDSFVHQRMIVLEQERSDEQKAITLVQELLRMHTQSVRNWGYFDNVRRVVHELYEPLDGAFTEHVGLSATQLAAAFVGLLRNAEQRINTAFNQLRDVLSKRSVASMIRRYYELNPQFTDTPDGLLALANKEQLTVDQTRVLVLSHIEYRLASIYTFSAASIASELAVAEEQVTRVFNRLSLSFGELASHQIDHLFLDNPVWRKPVIKIGLGRYFCAIPQAFFSFVRPILDDLISDNQPLEQTCEKRRADFLESELAQLFAKAFPGAQIIAGFRWRFEGKEYENDLLVRVDSALVTHRGEIGDGLMAGPKGRTGESQEAHRGAINCAFYSIRSLGRTHQDSPQITRIARCISSGIECAA